MKVKEESEIVGLKLNIQKTKIMASGPITSWEIDGETDFIFLGSKITADGDCSHEIKRHLFLGRKVMKKPRNYIKKQRHYFADKGPSRQSNVSAFYMLSRLVITFPPRSKHLLISWLQSPFAVILEPRKTKSATVSTVSPSISHEVMGPDAMILVF